MCRALGSRWLQQLPATVDCVDKPLAGGPQQRPDSVGNLRTGTVRDSGEPAPSLAAQNETSFPTEAKTRERARRTAQKAAGKAHVAKRRIRL